MSCKQAGNLNRIQYIDILKAFLIVLVVLGHSGFPFSTYIYWFHMPAFFIISGYLQKEIDKSSIYDYTFKKSFTYLIPYFSFLILITFFNFFINFGYFSIIKAFTPDSLAIRFSNLLYGGRILDGLFSVFWFVTCLFITNILFVIINSTVKSEKVKLVIYLSCYILAHVEANYIGFIKTSFPFPFKKSFPWNADVVLLSLPYFALGYYARKYSIIEKIYNKNLEIKILMSTVVAALLIGILDYFAVFKYVLNMKYSTYNNIILDMLVPIIFTLAFALISIEIDKRYSLNFVRYIGRNTLTIMYLHVPINIFIMQKFGIKYNWFINSIIGMLIPLLFTYLFDKNYITKAIFLGKINFKKTRIVESTNITLSD